MNSYLFTGKILPERVGLNIPKITFNDLIYGDGSKKSIGTLTVESKNGAVTANLITAENFYLATIKNSIEFYLQSIVDSFGYITGQVFDVDIDLVSGPEGAFSFTPKINSLFNNQNERPLPPETILRLASNNINLIRVLGNLREAIKQPMDVGLFCYRAIENIRQNFVSPNVSATKSWDLMHKSLNTSKTFLEEDPSLTQYSEESRHGETHSISDNDIEKILNKTWIIVDRFCVYLNNGNIGLNINDFPQL